MPSKPAKPKQDDPKQSARFVETAKAIGAATDPKTFDKAFRRVTKPKQASKPCKPSSL